MESDLKGALRFWFPDLTWVQDGPNLRADVPGAHFFVEDRSHGLIDFRLAYTDKLVSRFAWTQAKASQGNAIAGTRTALEAAHRATSAALGWGWKSPSEHPPLGIRVLALVHGEPVVVLWQGEERGWVSVSGDDVEDGLTSWMLIPVSK